MLLVDVRIKNYKCILDSETFTVDQMTCLVGKNESGKSAILQALYKLNPVDKEDIYDALYEYPKMYQTDFEAGEIPDGNTVLISHWKFTENEITEIDALFGSGFITKSTIAHGLSSQTSKNSLQRKRQTLHLAIPIEHKSPNSIPSRTFVRNSINSPSYLTQSNPLRIGSMKHSQTINLILSQKNIS